MLSSSIALILLAVQSSVLHALPMSNTNNCSDPGNAQGVTPICYQQLNIQQHLTDFIQSPQAQCDPGIPFATCFLGSLDMNNGGCANITVNSCTPPKWSDYKSHNISIEDFYIAWNIYSVWNFYNTYYQAVVAALPQASNNVVSIINLLDPPKKQNFELGEILAAFGAAISFIKGNPLLEAAVNAITQSATLTRTFLPAGSSDTRLTQIGNLDQSLNGISLEWEGNLTSSLYEVQSNATVFAQVVSSGAFSVDPVINIPTGQASVYYGLDTYIIARSLAANNWQIVRAIDTDVNAGVANQSIDVEGCGSGYDGNNLCGAWWYDTVGQRSFSLCNTKNPGKDPTHIMQALFQNWTTPAALFTGAAQCQVEGGSSPTVTTTAGNVVYHCLSNTKVCTYNINNKNYETEYTDCRNDNMFGEINDNAFCIHVPTNYLGPYPIPSSIYGSICSQ